MRHDPYARARRITAGSHHNAWRLSQTDCASTNNSTSICRVSYPSLYTSTTTRLGLPPLAVSTATGSLASPVSETGTSPPLGWRWVLICASYSSSLAVYRSKSQLLRMGEGGGGDHEAEIIYAAAQILYLDSVPPYSSSSWCGSKKRANTSGMPSVATFFFDTKCTFATVLCRGAQRVSSLDLQPPSPRPSVPQRERA